MAYTHFDQLDGVGGAGSSTPPTPNYYMEDTTIVYNQAGAVNFGPAAVTFRGEPITVFAAFDNNESIMTKMALPCPPYFELTNPEAIPGKYLPK